MDDRHFETVRRLGDSPGANRVDPIDQFRLTLSPIDGRRGGDGNDKLGAQGRQCRPDGLGPSQIKFGAPQGK